MRPTMSFPVAGTLMVEPTESEDLAEIDRFCDAMIAIRGEIARGRGRRVARRREPAAHAPRIPPPTSSPTRGTARTRARRPRSRRRASAAATDKYWPPVSRIDGAFGDRNLMCSCPPLSAYEDDVEEAGE